MELDNVVVSRMRDDARRLGLLHADLLLYASDKTVVRVCNGIGPSGFPPWALWLLECLLPHVVLPSVIHDLRYYYGDLTREDFLDANRELAENARIVSRALPWWRVARKVAVVAAGALCAALCDWFGWNAYCSAYAERRSAEQEDRACAQEETHTDDTAASEDTETPCAEDASMPYATSGFLATADAPCAEAPAVSTAQVCGRRKRHTAKMPKKADRRTPRARNANGTFRKRED